MERGSMYYEEVAPTVELMDFSKSIRRRISRFEKMIEGYEKKLSDVLQTRDLLVDADNSINACPKGDDVPVWAVLENIKHLLNSGVKNGT